MMNKKQKTSFFSTKTAITASMLAFLLSASCSSKGKEDGNATAVSDSVSAVGGETQSAPVSDTPLALEASFYKQFKGTLNGNIPVVFDVVKNGDALSGSYLYEKQGIPIYISGLVKDGSLEYSEFDLQGQTTAKIKLLLLEDGRAQGTWEDTTGKKTFNLELKQTPADALTALKVLASSDSTVINKHGAAASSKYEYVALVPQDAGSEAGKKLAKVLMSPYKEAANGAADIAAIHEKNKKEEFKGFKEQMADVDDPGMMPSMNWVNSTSDKVVFNGENLLCIESSSYSYTGGAHGNYGSSYLVVDVARGAAVAYNDIFLAKSKDKLTQLIGAKLADQYDMPKGGKLTDVGFFDEKVAPNDNFFMTSKGVGFFYNPYEVSPYAMGTVSVFFKFKELEGCLNTSGPMAKFFLTK